MQILEQPHRRFNQLLGEWVLVSPQRSALATSIKTPEINLDLPDYDKECYLCPGNERVTGQINDDYDQLFAFDDDYPALLPRVVESYDKLHHLLRVEPVSGSCRILVYSPEHNATLATLSLDQLHAVVDAWSAEIGELGEHYLWVQIFERRGLEMGGHNYHPHCQIWATNVLPTIALKEDKAQSDYFHEHGIVLLQEYAELEMQQDVRVVINNEHWVVVVPFWAEAPYETLLIPRRHVHNFPELTSEERDALASILKRLMLRYSELFGQDFSYTLGWHGAPYNHGDVNHWQLHGHVYPAIRAGLALLSESQRDITPEIAAEKLRG